jgi:hypothetical protein
LLLCTIKTDNTMKKIFTLCLVAFLGVKQIKAQPIGGYISISKNAVSLREVPHPNNPNLRMVEILLLGTTNNTINHSLFYPEPGTGKPIAYGSCSMAAANPSSGSNYVWVPLFAGTLNDAPQNLYDMVGLVCGNVPCWGFDSTYPLQTNPCKSANSFTDPNTWDFLRVPQLGTVGASIWKDVFVTENTTITQQISVEDAKTLTINAGKTLTLGMNAITTDLGRFEHYSTSAIGTVINNGVVNGNLSVRGTKFVNNGIIAPGNIPAMQFKQANFYNLNCTPNSIIELKLNSTGYSPGDRIYIDDSCRLNGKLKINFAGGFTPQVGDRFSVLHSYPNVYNDSFSSLELPACVIGRLEYRKNPGSYSYVDVVITGINVPLTISSPTSVCVGQSINLTANQTGGFWSSIAGKVSINASGLVTGTSSGVALIRYTLPVAPTLGCLNYVEKTISVNALPAVPSVAYQIGTPNPRAGAPAGSFCRNRTFTLVGFPAGGSLECRGCSQCK